MSKVSRSDWAAQVPASGIQGVIPAANLPSTGAGTTDIGTVKGAGFSPGQVPIWNGGKFVPGNLPVVPTASGVTITSQLPYIAWTPSSLRSLESTEVTVPLPGVTMTSLVFVAPLPGLDYLWFRAVVLSPGQVVITATNMSGVVVALVDSTYQVFVLT